MPSAFLSNTIESVKSSAREPLLRRFWSHFWHCDIADRLRTGSVSGTTSLAFDLAPAIQPQMPRLAMRGSAITVW